MLNSYFEGLNIGRVAKLEIVRDSSLIRRTATPYPLGRLPDSPSRSTSRRPLLSTPRAYPRNSVKYSRTLKIMLDLKYRPLALTGHKTRNAPSRERG